MTGADRGFECDNSCLCEVINCNDNVVMCQVLTSTSRTTVTASTQNRKYFPRIKVLGSRGPLVVSSPL